MWNVIKKGYKVDLDRIYCGHDYDDLACQAENLNQAKSLLMKLNDNNYLELETSFETPVTYKTIPVIPCEDYDIVEYDGKEMPRDTANRLQRYEDKKVENDKILNDSSIKFVFIKRDGWYYRGDYCGYTEYPIEAGVYTKEDAHKHCGNILELNIVPINVEYYNALIQETINKLQTKILEQ